MTHSRLRNKYLKEKSADSKIAYDEKRNYCVNLLRSTKKKYFANINISYITGNKKLWKTVEPLFSDKISHKEAINLPVNGTVLSDNQETTNCFNLNILDPVEAAILKDKNHPSLNAIRGKISKLDNQNFYFEYTSFDQTLQELEKPDPKKASQVNVYLLK